MSDQTSALERAGEASMRDPAPAAAAMTPCGSPQPACAAASVTTAPLAGPAARPLTAPPAWSARRFMLTAAQSRTTGRGRAGVPRQRARTRVPQLRDHALGVGHPALVRPDAGRALQCSRARTAWRWASVFGGVVFGEHRALPPARGKTIAVLSGATWTWESWPRLPAVTNPPSGGGCTRSRESLIHPAVSPGCWGSLPMLEQCPRRGASP